MGLLDGETALVTGAAQGIGAAIARGMATEGASVIFADLQAGAAEAMAASLGGEALELDVQGDLSALSGVEVSVLVNAAGVIARTPIEAEDALEEAERQWRVNAYGAMAVTRALIPSLRARQGRVVNICSICSYISYPLVSGYAASKGALAQITRSLAVELAPDIRVNGVAPGVIETEMTAATRADPTRSGAFLGKTPMGRFGRAEEIVGPAVFLASDMSSYVTGEILAVDGGFLAG